MPIKSFGGAVKRNYARRRLREFFRRNKELFPENADALLKRGWEFGQSRIVCNVHWQSDANQGRIMGAAAVARLHADPGFLEDLEAAKKEIALLRSYQ